MTTARPILLLLLVLAVARPALSVPAVEDPVLTVFAAADLTLAFKEIVPRFEKAHSVKVRLVLGSTGNLAKQIEHGAPADVFFAANRSFMDDLVGKGAVIKETRALYAQGRIVLAVPKGAAAGPTDPRDLLDRRIRRIAIANPQHAPYGKAAEQALTRLGLWEALKPKLVYGENIRHALQFVETGAADAGIIALSVADLPGIQWTLIDASLHEPLDQWAAVVRRSRRPELGLALIQFVNGPEGRSIMRRFGFRLPAEL